MDLATGDIWMQERKGSNVSKSLLCLDRAELSTDARYSGEGRGVGRGDDGFTPSSRCLWDNQIELSGGQLKHWLERDVGVKDRDVGVSEGIAEVRRWSEHDWRHIYEKRGGLKTDPSGSAYTEGIEEEGNPYGILFRSQSEIIIELDKLG